LRAEVIGIGKGNEWKRRVVEAGKWMQTREQVLRSRQLYFLLLRLQPDNHSHILLDIVPKLRTRIELGDEPFLS
jgi:hypothetical protein